MREHRRVELFLQPGRVLRTGFQLLVVRASMIPELGELRNHVALLGDLDVEPPSMKSWAKELRNHGAVRPGNRYHASSMKS